VGDADETERRAIDALLGGDAGRGKTDRQDVEPTDSLHPSRWWRPFGNRNTGT